MAKLYFKVGSDWEEVVRLRNEITKLKQELKGMDSTQSPAAFKALNTQLSASTHRMNELVVNAAKAGAVMEGGFKKKIFDASQTVNGFTEKIIAQKNTIKSFEQDLRRVQEAWSNAVKNGQSTKGLENPIRLKKVILEEKDALFNLTQEQANARLSVKKLRDEYSLYKKEGGESIDVTKQIEQAMSNMGKKILGGYGIKEFLSQLVRVRGEFQSMQTAIETMVGKDMAGQLIPQIKELAKISPLTMSDMVGAEKMMLGFNIQAEDTIKYLKAISDISMGESGKFNSLTLAFSQMSAAGKLMGQDFNQMVNAGFNPLQQISEKTGKSIATLKDEMSKGAISAEMVQQAFIDATSAGGKFFGMSENASKTINGQISMMQDALDNAFNEMGQKSEGVIMKGIQMTTSLIENYETVGKILTGLIVTYGTYRAAVMLVTAAESKHTLVEIGLTNVRILARKAQLALNAAMLTNPYVLLAVAVGGLITANLTLVDTTRQLKVAEDDYNKTRNEAIAKEQKYNAEIDNNLSIAKNSKAAIDDRKEALVKLIQEYPAVFEKYKTEAEMLQHILDIEKEIAIIRNNNSTSNPKNELNDVNKQIADLEKLAKQRYHGGRGLNNAENAKLEMLKNRRSELEGTLKKEEADAVVADLTGYSNAQIEAAIKDREHLLAKMQLKGVNTGTITGKSILSGTFSKNELEGQKKLLESEKATREAEKKSSAEWLASYKKAYEDAEKAYKDFLSSKQVMSDADRDKELKRLKGLRDAAKATYENKGGSTSSGTKQEPHAEKLRKEQEKYNLLLDKQALEQKRSAEDLQMKVDEARIKAMDEGSAKTIAEMELNFEKEMQAIDRQKEDALRKKLENARAAWDANPGNKGKSFEATDIKLSDDEQKYYDELYKAAIANNEKTYSELTNQYLSYTDQRLEIEKKFNDDIAVLQEARKKAVEKGDTDEVAKIDRSIAKATADKGKELMRHDFDVLKQSPEYIRAFEDLKNTSSGTLNSLLEQLENAKQAAAQTLNPEDLREYTTTIQEIMDELDARNPFQALADRQRELAEAEKELAEAKLRLDAVNRGDKIVTGVKSTSLGKDGKIKVENTYLTAAEALNKYNAAKDKHQQANNNFIKAEKTAREKVDELADAIRGIGDAIGGQAGEIISLMGDVALFATGTIDGISQVAQTGEEAISAVEKASVILGIVSTSVQLLQKIGELGSNKAFKQYEAYAEKIKEINALTDAVNEYRIAALEAQQAENNWFSEDNLRNLRDYKKVHDEVAKAYDDKAMESQAIYKNQSGGGWLTGAANWVMGNLSPMALLGDKWKNIWGQGDYDKGQTAAINNLRIETRKKSKGFLGTGIGGKSQKTEDLSSWIKKQKGWENEDLFDEEGLINVDLGKEVIEKYGNKLVGQTKETLEALIELREQYDEYLEQLHEYVSSLYEPLVDNFVDSLWDWLDNGKDALDSFKGYASDTFRGIVSDMMKTIVLDKVVGNFDDDIAKLYEKYASGKISEEELMNQVADRTGSLVDNYERNIPALENMLSTVNGYFKDAGIDLAQPDDSSREASKKGIATASQESVDENNGRLTVIQGHTYGINENVNRMAAGIDTIANHTVNLSCLTNIDKTMQSLLSMRDASLTHLSNIDQHTARLENIEASLASMKNGIDTLNTKGITLKR